MRQSFHYSTGFRVALGSAAIVWLAALAISGTAAAQTFGTIPAGTRLRLHLTAAVSSEVSRSGTPFTFVLLDPVSVDGHVVLATGAMGNGTLYLAGHAGASGHEGDLTLRLDSVRTADDHEALFSDQRFEMNGRNRKIASGLLGFIPYVGLGAHFIRGSAVRVDPATPIETVLQRPARITVAQDPPSLQATPGATAVPSGH